VSERGERERERERDMGTVQELQCLS